MVGLKIKFRNRNRYDPYEVHKSLSSFNKLSYFYPFVIVDNEDDHISYNMGLPLQNAKSHH